jgi:predicted DNA-binding protein
MATTRISESDHRLLQNLANQTGKQHQQIIHEALDTYQREQLLDSINDGYARLKADKRAWAAMKGERLLLEESGNDGLED